MLQSVDRSFYILQVLLERTFKFAIPGFQLAESMGECGDAVAYADFPRFDIIEGEDSHWEALPLWYAYGRLLATLCSSSHCQAGSTSYIFLSTRPNCVMWSYHSLFRTMVYRRFLPSGLPVHVD
jgi:hypothetical protein